jgi:hypothetical protein
LNALASAAVVVDAPGELRQVMARAVAAESDIGEMLWELGPDEEGNG